MVSQEQGQDIPEKGPRLKEFLNGSQMRREKARNAKKDEATGKDKGKGKLEESQPHNQKGALPLSSPMQAKQTQGASIRGSPEMIAESSFVEETPMGMEVEGACNQVDRNMVQGASNVKQPKPPDPPPQDQGDGLDLMQDDNAQKMDCHSPRSQTLVDDMQA